MKELIYRFPTKTIWSGSYPANWSGWASGRLWFVDMNEKKKDSQSRRNPGIIRSPVEQLREIGRSDNLTGWLDRWERVSDTTVVELLPIVRDDLIDREKKEKIANIIFSSHSHPVEKKRLFSLQIWSIL